jgi:hypothetical protein
MLAAYATVMAATNHVFALHVLIHSALQQIAAMHMLRKTADLVPVRIIQTK